MSSKDNDEKHVIHPKSDSIEIMVNNKADEVIEEHFQSLLSKYQMPQLGWKHQWKVGILYLIVFIYCIAIAIKEIWNIVDNI